MLNRGICRFLFAYVPYLDVLPRNDFLLSKIKKCKQSILYDILNNKT